MTRQNTVVSLSCAETSEVHAKTLAAAFQDDPSLAWIAPDPEQRRRLLPRFFKVMIEQSHRHGTVLSSPNGDAVSLWYPPGQIKNGLIASAWDSLRLIGAFATALPRGIKVSDAMHAQHPNPQPHSYLRYVGVAPDAQGKGWGGALVREGISRSTNNRLGIILETALESNAAIYSRLGFEIQSEWTVPNAGPRFWTMIRDK